MNTTITGYFGCVLEKNTGWKSHDYRGVSVSKKLRFKSVFVHTKTETRIERKAWYGRKTFDLILECSVYGPVRSRFAQTLFQL